MKAILSLVIKSRPGFTASQWLGGPSLTGTLPDYTLALRPGSPWRGCSEGHTTGCHAPWPISSGRWLTQRPQCPVVALTCVHAQLPGSLAGLLTRCTCSLTSLTPASSSASGSSDSPTHHSIAVQFKRNNMCNVARPGAGGQAVSPPSSSP